MLPPPPASLNAKVSNPPDPADYSPVVEDDGVTPRVKLTEEMRQRALDRIYKFQRQRWPLRKSAKSLYLPSICLIPHTLLFNLLDHFHLIRDHETLADIMVEWEYLEFDGHALYDVIRSLNEEFDEEHLRRKKESAAKGTLTRAVNTAKKRDGGTSDPDACIDSTVPHEERSPF